MLKTEVAITLVKETFSKKLREKLNLFPISSPIAILDGTGINDDLNGIERPVAFPIKALNEQRAVVVHSLAKWKRVRIKQLGIEAGAGILTDMKALRPDEDYSAIHSIYVDQWDWEQHILPEQRTLNYLKETVDKIYETLKQTEKAVEDAYPELKAILPEQIHFISTEELLQQYPGMTSKERENAVAKAFGAVFIYGIGGKLSSGEPHDGRAPDYDDWSSDSGNGYKGLNGDIIVWNDVLGSSLELSSMGIRVDSAVLKHQLEISGCMDRSELTFHKMLLNGELTESIGGGIGQSRVCMFLLRKKHIGEVQVSIWNETVREKLQSEGIKLL
jgi:aspartate--ammonia ligase